MDPSSASARQPGSVEAVTARLLLWARRAPHGLARVEFNSEHSRRRAVERLRLGLAEMAISLHEVTLPEGMEPSALVRWLVERLAGVEPGVVSISGFATAFPSDISLADALQVFNFNRENLAVSTLRQVWWMTPHFADTFLCAVPDLSSWFMVRLQLTEVVAEPAPILAMDSASTSTSLGFDEARRRAASLAVRFDQAVAQRARVTELREFAAATLAGLREAGAAREAEALERRMRRRVREVGVLPRVLVCGVPSATLSGRRVIH